MKGITLFDVTHQMLVPNKKVLSLLPLWWGRRGRDRMVVGFTTTYAISAYHN